MINSSIQNPLISVIIPCYNVEKYLDRCLKSIVHQTYRNLEIILVDDGSPDSSGIICDRWADKDNRIIVIHKENGGLGFARNSGIKIAKGEYIAFVDSDDYIDITMYEKLIATANNTNSDVVYCGIFREQSNGKIIRQSDFNTQMTFEKKDLIELSQGFFKPTSLTPQMLSMSVWHSIYKHNIIQTKFYSEREVGSEDLHFQISAVLRAQRVTFIPDCLYYYCYNGESLSHSFLFDKFRRYKVLTNYVNNIFSSIGIKGQAEYYAFVISFVSSRQSLLSKDNVTSKMYIKQLAEDSFWDKCDIRGIKLSLSKKIFYYCLKNHHPNILYNFSRIYSYINYNLLGKSHR